MTRVFLLAASRRVAEDLETQQTLSMLAASHLLDTDPGVRKMKWNLTIGAIAAGALALTATRVGGEAKPVQHIEISASRFSFEPHEITVKKGEPVTLTVRSTDVTHGLVVEELGIRTEVKKGETENLTITPEAAGTFEGQCAHFCGKGHGSMKLTFHVVQ